MVIYLLQLSDHVPNVALKISFSQYSLMTNGLIEAVIFSLYTIDF